MFDMRDIPEHPAGHQPTCELHAHLGASVPASVLWSMAHEQGIKLPVKSYWEFEKIVTVGSSVGGVSELTSQVYDAAHLIQSSPQALTAIIQHAVGGAYRHSNVVAQEWRICPMRRNRGGEFDLDYIILALLHGLDKAKIEYPFVRAGLIFEMYRGYSVEENTVILNKAIKYARRGVIGIDISGPKFDSFNIRDYVQLLLKAKNHGLGVTIHLAEEGQNDCDLDELRYVMRSIVPDRIGHGIQAYRDPTLMKLLARTEVALEICHTSNINCRVLTEKQVREAVKTLADNGVILTFNTDGPDAHRTTLVREFDLMRDLLGENKIEEIRQNAFNVSFFNLGGG